MGLTAEGLGERGLDGTLLLRWVGRGVGRETARKWGTRHRDGSMEEGQGPGAREDRKNHTQQGMPSDNTIMREARDQRLTQMGPSVSHEDRIRGQDASQREYRERGNTPHKRQGQSGARNGGPGGKDTDGEGGTQRDGCKAR